MIIINITRLIVRICLVMVLSILFCQQALSQNFSVEATYELSKEKLEKGHSLKDNSLMNSLDSPVNLLTGAVDFDIPIYTIRIGDYSLPINLHYETSGFRLTEIGSDFGLGWSLNGIGCITKTIKGAPDIYYNHNMISQFSNLTALTTPEQFQALIQITDCNGIDKEPDIYSFHFAGHSGNFLFDQDISHDRIYMIPQQNLIINFSNDVFTITDELGNIYYFGEGNSKEILKLYNNTSLSRSESYWNNPGHSGLWSQCGIDGSFFEGERDYIISWHLSKIKLASSNIELLFEYEHDHVRAYIGSDETYMYGSFSDDNNPQHSHTDWMALKYNRFKYVYEPRITKIMWKQDNCEIGSIVFIPYNEYRNDLQNTEHYEGAHMIERIDIKDMVANINHSYRLGYKNTGLYGYHYDMSFGIRIYLEHLIKCDSHGNELNYYYFSYNHNKNVFRNSSKIDYWGYYKNTSTSNDFYLMKPRIYYYADGKSNPLYNSVYSVWKRSGDTETFVLEGNNLSPELADARQFTLKSVKMPLGLTVEFVYENNNFYFDSQEITGPGVRVKEVKYKDGGLQYKTTYEYIGDDGKSSGRISSIPDFGYYNTTAVLNDYHDHQPNTYAGRNIITARQITTVSDMSGSSQANVRYGKVTVKNAKTGKTEYYNHLVFNAEDDSVCIGDNNYVFRTPIRRAIYTQLTPQNNCISSGILPHEDSFPNFTEPIISWCGNYLKKTIVYNIDNEIVESTEYNYSLKPSDITVPYLQSRYYTRFDCPWNIIGENGNTYGLPFVLQRDILWGTNSYRTGVRRLDSIVNIKYDGGIENRTVTAYKYYDDIGKNLFVKEKSVKNSDGIVEKTNYTYPFNYSTPLMDSLRRRNIIATPVEEYVSKDGKVIDGTFKNYKYFGSYIRPNKVYRLRAASPLTNFSPSISGNQDARYEEVMSLKYDNTSGNTIETTEEGNAVTTYVWGYHHSLLLAVVKNATKDEVAGSLSCTMNELQNKTDSDELIHIFNNLRENMPDALITSYTYDASQHPLSVTNPNGKTCKYEYDDASRLNIIRDQDNNIVKSYDYHYR